MALLAFDLLAHDARRMPDRPPASVAAGIAATRVPVRTRRFDVPLGQQLLVDLDDHAA